MKIYDANDQILGRLSTTIAKDLLKGEKVAVVNCEKSVLSGNTKFTTNTYLQKIQKGDRKKGPFFPKTPDGIFKRTVRGMLPWKIARGKKAFKNLRVFIGLPEQFKNKTLERLESADVNRLTTTYISLENVSIAIGAKKRW